MPKITIEVDEAEHVCMAERATTLGLADVGAYLKLLAADDAVPASDVAALAEVQRRQAVFLSDALAPEESMRRLCEKMGWDSEQFSNRVKQRVMRHDR